MFTFLSVFIVNINQTYTIITTEVTFENLIYNTYCCPALNVYSELMLFNLIVKPIL